MNENIEHPPHRSWVSSDADSNMRCYLRMERRITARELADYLAEHHPHVDFWSLRLNFATAVWEEPPTEEDLAQREAGHRRQAERQEQWERETYARLKAKFEHQGGA